MPLQCNLSSRLGSDINKSLIVFDPNRQHVTHQHTMRLDRVIEQGVSFKLLAKLVDSGLMSLETVGQQLWDVGLGIGNIGKESDIDDVNIRCLAHRACHFVAFLDSLNDVIHPVADVRLAIYDFGIDDSVDGFLGPYPRRLNCRRLTLRQRVRNQT